MSSVISSILKNALKTSSAVQQVRFYPRWSHRKPKRVYSPEEFEKLEHNDPPNDKTSETFLKTNKLLELKSDKFKTQRKPIKYNIKPNKDLKPLVATNQVNKKSEVKTSVDMFETILDNEGNFIYTKMKNNDLRVGKILTEVKSKKISEKKNFILLEGKRLIKDALSSGCQLKYIIFSRKAEVEYLKPYLPKLGAQLYKMPYKEMQMWSDLSTTPGIMGIFKTPDPENFTPKESLPISVICDNIREPGNLGTILRISAAIGCESVILTKGCVNLWDTKVLRSAVGAHFKLKISRELDWDKIENLIGVESSIFIADNKIISGEYANDLAEILEKIPLLPYYGVNFKISNKLVLIVGGETLGISQNAYQLALKNNGARLNIPLSNDVDSLNVGAALSVIAFEIKKQLINVCK